MRPRHGFTLIEVIGATAAFVIAFLAGTAAFTRLLHHEMANYHRALAGELAIRWGKDAALGAPATAIDESTNPVLFAGLGDRLFITQDTEFPSNGTNYCIKIFYGDPGDATPTFLGRYHKRISP